MVIAQSNGPSHEAKEVLEAGSCGIAVPPDPIHAVDEGSVIPILEKKCPLCMAMKKQVFPSGNRLALKSQL